MITVKKKDGKLEDFNPQKLIDAVDKAAFRVGKKLSSKENQELVNSIRNRITSNPVSVAEIHEIVIAALNMNGFHDIAESYAEYRYYKTAYARTFEKLRQDADDVLRLGDRENANFDSSLVSTKGSLIKGYLTKSLYKQFYLSNREKELIERGDIYIHDLRDMILGSLNCFRKDTKFVTDKGLRSFKDFNSGEQITVLTHTGEWKRAIVRCYGKKQLQKIYIKRSRGNPKVIYATKNHRWILNNEKTTTSLQVGDILCDTPNITQSFNWESLNKTEKTMWCLGFLYGDGSQSRSSACTMRLCGDKNKYAYRFEECGYTVTTPNNKGWNNDSLVWMHDTAKVLPPEDFMNPSYTQAFINGLLCADEGKDTRSKQRNFRSLQITSDKNIIKRIYGMLHTAGYYVSSYSKVESNTNFGIRSKLTVNFKIYEGTHERTNWRVASIKDTNIYEKVWCLEVEDNHSFILEGGIPTGNCCLFDIGTVLKNGFEMSNVEYTEPKSVLSALQVTGDITLVATAQQFGGFTLAEFDKVLLPYCKKTLNRAAVDFEFMCPEPKNEEDFKKAQKDFAWHTLEYELRQGFQSLELKLNTVPCSRGDFAFTTLTFGQWDPNLPEEDKNILSTIGRMILETRKNGHGKSHKPVVFPKLVFLYDANQIEQDSYSQKLFDKAVETSAECMYPDYLSLTSKHGTVSRIYKEQGVITSPMGKLS